MRKDGKRLKNCDPMYAIASFIMKERNDAHNTITIDLPLEPMRNYMNKYRKQGVQISHMALILAAYIRTMADFPALNRFVVNSRVYARNDISAAMVVLKSGGTGETMSKMYFHADDTIFDVNKTITDYVDTNRKVEEKNNFDHFINKIVNTPGLLHIGVPFLMWLDRHSLLPKSVIALSPFHESLVITNLASIRTDFIHHHIYNFGTVSVFFAMGTPREVPRRKNNGDIYFETCLPLGIVMDERVATGSYFARAFHYFKRYIEHPELLEQKPDHILADPEL